MHSNETDPIGLQSVKPESTASKNTERSTIYFDGSCPLCSAEIKHYSSRDKDKLLKFVDVSAQNADLGNGLDCTDAMARFHVRLHDDTLLSGARAFVAVWDTLPGWKWAARLARIPGVTPALEVGYRAFLPVRPFLSKLAGYFGARAANAQSGAE